MQKPEKPTTPPQEPPYTPPPEKPTIVPAEPPYTPPSEAPAPAPPEITPLSVSTRMDR